MRFTTQSGASYEIQPGRVRRVNPGAVKRGDGDWQELVAMIPVNPRVGERVTLVMGSLAHYGADDIGTPREMASGTTTRTTTRVVSIEGGAE